MSVLNILLVTSSLTVFEAAIQVKPTNLKKIMLESQKKG